MTDRKGLFTSAQEDFIAKLLDDAVKFKNPFLEMADGLAFKLLVQTVDNQGLDKIPEVWKAELRKLVDAAMAKNWNEVRALMVDLLVAHADFFKNAEASLLFFDGISRIVMAAIDWYAQKTIGETVLPK
jgi:hypothetical protein